MQRAFGMSHLKEEYLGETSITEDLFDSFIDDIRDRFTAENYDLLNHNCNNFTNEAAEFLLGNGIPDYIINLPNVIRNHPIFAQLSPMLSSLGVIRGVPNNVTNPIPQQPPVQSPPIQQPPVQQPVQQPVFPSPPVQPPVQQPTQSKPPVQQTTQNKEVKTIIFPEMSQTSVCIYILQSTLSSTATLLPSDIELLPRLCAELNSKPEYTLSPNSINYLI